ncbi:OmpA family protein [Pseudogemmobacter sonorensis]|uniref:OmpA family protein n=1 Tax=Pseudogemmobacter sonorensis TaxID=2989681 RepID=UPI003687EEEA
MTKTSLVLGLSGLIALSACVDPYAYDDPNARQKQGALIGAVSGAVLAGATANDDKLEKAVIGGVVGGIAGAAIGYSLDQQAAELRGTLSPGITVTNRGDHLVVNMPEALLFATDSATVSPSLTRDLNSVAASLLKYPQSRIEVVGHTDNTGSASYNMDLSQRRASSVATILRNAGVPSARLTASGRGFNEPIASNNTAEGRAQNRRVEIFIRPTN